MALEYYHNQYCKNRQLEIVQITNTIGQFAPLHVGRWLYIRRGAGTAARDKAGLLLLLMAVLAAVEATGRLKLSRGLARLAALYAEVPVGYVLRRHRLLVPLGRLALLLHLRATSKRRIRYVYTEREKKERYIDKSLGTQDAHICIYTRQMLLLLQGICKLGGDKI